MRSKFLAGMLFCLLASLVAAQTEEEQPEAAAEPEAEPEPMFGTLDYILLAAIGAAAIWWLFFRDSEGDKIPEVGFTCAFSQPWDNHLLKTFPPFQFVSF